MADAAAQLRGKMFGAVSSRNRWLVGSLIISIFAVLAILYLTKLGAGASGDSVHYLMGAENILAGKGYARTTGDGTTRPITSFPPGYSLLIAAVGMFDTEISFAARWLNALLFGANLWLASYLVFRGTRSVVPALLTSITLGVAAPLVGLHGWIMTEPAYIFFSLVAFIGLHHYLESGRLGGLFAAAVAISLATLTRYIGLSLILTSGLAILFLGNAVGRQRLRDSIFFGFLSLGPVGLWLVRNTVISGTAVNREIIFHAIRRELVDQYLAAAVEWIIARAVIPWRPRVFAAAVIGVAAPTALIIHDVRSKSRVRLMGRLEWLLILYLPSYLLILAVNYYWLDASTIFGDPKRYLAPAFVPMIMLAIIGYWKWWSLSAPRSLIRIAIPLVAVFLIGLHMLETASLFTGDELDRGYVTLRENSPELVDTLSKIHPDRVLVSNNPELVYVLSGRPAYSMPIAFDISTQELREDFNQQLAATDRRLKQGGRLVLFGTLDPVDQKTLEMLGAVRFDSFPGAAIFGYLEP